MSQPKTKRVVHRKTFHRGRLSAYYKSTDGEVEVCEHGPARWWHVSPRQQVIVLVVSNEEREGHLLKRDGATDWLLLRSGDSGEYPDQTVFYPSFDRWLTSIADAHPEVKQWYLALEA